MKIRVLHADCPKRLSGGLPQAIIELFGRLTREARSYV